MTGESNAVFWRLGLVSSEDKQNPHHAMIVFLRWSFQCWPFSMCLRYKHQSEPSPACLSHHCLKELKLNAYSKGYSFPWQYPLRIRVCWVIPRRAQIHPGIQPPWLPVHISMCRTAYHLPSRTTLVGYVPLQDLVLQLPWVPRPGSSPGKLKARGGAGHLVTQGTMCGEAWWQAPAVATHARWPEQHLCLQTTSCLLIPRLGRPASGERGSKDGAWEERKDCCCNTGSRSYNLLCFMCCHKESNIWLQTVIYMKLLSKGNVSLPYLSCLVCQG